MQTRTSVFRSLALFGAIAFGVAACEPKTEVILPAEPTSIDVQPGSLTLTVGQSQALSINVVNPPPGQTANPTCTSSDPSVASISGGCVVTGVSVGSTSVTVSSGTTPAFTRTVGVTVTARTTNAQITLTPQTATIGRGDSIVVVASVSGVQNTGVIFRTSDASVATVQDMGTTAVVRGVSNGTAVITAIAEADTTIRASSTIQVGGGQGSGSIGFGTITQFNTNSPVDPANVQGRIDVTLNVVPGDNDALRVVVLDSSGAVVDTVDGCSRSFGGSSSASQTVTCTLNTAEFDSAGVAAFTNGNFTLEARLLNGGDVSVSATSNVLAFRNVDILSARVSRDTSAIGADGLLWNGGDITFNLRPVTFSGQAGASPAQATVTITGFVQGDSVSVTETDDDAGDGLSVTFSASNDIAEFNTGPDGANVTISSVTGGGQQGASGRFGPQCSVASPPAGCSSFVYTDLQSGTSSVNNTLRIDNQSPIANEAVTDDDARQLLEVSFPEIAGADETGGFLNAGAQFRQGVFTQTYVTPGDPTNLTAGPAGSLPDDAPYGTQGVDRVSISFRAVLTGPAGPGSESAASLFARGTPVDSAGQLPGTAQPDQYVVVARVADLLDNFDYVFLTRDNGMGGVTPLFGVDRFRPEITFAGTATGNASVADSAILRVPLDEDADEFVFSVSDSDGGADPTDGGPSGFGPNAVRVSLARYAANAAGGQCYALTAGVAGAGPGVDFEGNTTASGRGSAPSCTFYSTNGVIDVPSDEGYYIVRAFVVDRAGNVSADTVTRIILVDDTAPTVTITAFSSSAAQITTTGILADNVDLFAFDNRLQFGAEVYPVTLLLQNAIGEFGTPVNFSMNVNQAYPNVRSITATDAAGAPVATPPVARTGAGYGVVDRSGIFAQAFQAFGAPTLDAGGIFVLNGNATQIQAFAVTTPSSAVTVCNNAAKSGCASSTPTSTTVAAVATGPTNTFERPFALVNFFMTHPVYGTQVLFATSDTPVATEVTSPTVARTWTYSATFTATAPLPNTTGAAGTVYPIRAVGLAADGDALVSQDNTNITVDGIVYTVPAPVTP